MELADAQRLFSPEGTYLNTASYGLPPRPAWEALQAAQDEWRHGRTGFDGWDESVGRSRTAWARLCGVPVADVAIGPQVSPFAGLVAAALEPGAQVLAAREDFTSILFPLLAQEARGVQVRLVDEQREQHRGEVLLGGEHPRAGIQRCRDHADERRHLRADRDVRRGRVAACTASHEGRGGSP